MASIRYPRPLRPGDRIAITAPSSGVQPRHHARLEVVIRHLREQGYEVIEGRCLRGQHKHVSAPKKERAAEFQRFWLDDGIAAILPPWGGELLVEILPLLDFERLAEAPPKWISGFSDVSTLLLPLTVVSRVASVHGSNLMDLAPSQTDPLTTGLMKVFTLGAEARWVQRSSERFQQSWADFETEPRAPLNLSEPTRWRMLDGSDHARFQGRIIGGCLDTIARLAGTPYGDLAAFNAGFAEGVVFYFENCELPPCELARTLWNIRLAGWFRGVNGILIGRSSGPDAKTPDLLSYDDALRSVLGDLPIPIVCDTDIGHRPPQLSIVNGSLAEVTFDRGGGSLTQTLKS